MDSDENETQQIVNEFIERNRNSFTNKIDFFEKDLENYLGIETPKRKDLKPLNVMFQYNNGKIGADKIIEFKEKISNLIE